MKLHTVFALSALVAAMCVGPLSGRAQFHSYMSFTGKPDGAFKARGGSSGNLTSVVDVSAIMDITRKSAGSASHGPITVTKEVDPASPLLLNAHTTNEVLPQISFMVYKPGDNSKWKLVTFDNAVLTGLTVKKGVKNPNGDPGRGKATQQAAAPKTGTTQTNDQEEVSFTFQKISVVYYSGGNVSTTDDWNAQGQ